MRGMKAHKRKKSFLPHHELLIFPGVLARKDPMKQVVLGGNDTARPYEHAASKSEPSNHPFLSMGKDFLDDALGRGLSLSPQFPSAFHVLCRKSSLGIMDQEEVNAESDYAEGDTGFWEV